MKAGILVMVLAAILVSAPAFGNAPAPDKDADEWHFYIAPYFFLTSLSGDAAVPSPDGGSLELPVGLKFKDIADNLDWALAGVFQVKRNKWAFALDLSHSELSNDQTLYLPGPQEKEVEATTSVTMDEYELFVGYQFNDGFPASDFIFGVRYVGFDMGLEGTGDNQEIDVSADETFYVPFFGIRYYGPLSEDSKWSPFIRGDVGGLATLSKLNWRVNFGIAWLFSDHFDLSLQYKWKKDNYVNGEAGDSDYFRIDLLEYGPQLGLGIRF